MRLAFLVESIELERGGAERAVMTMARELEKLGHQCAIIAPGDRGQIRNHDGPQLLLKNVESTGRAARAREVAEDLCVLARKHGYETLVSCGKILGAQFHWPHGGVHEAGLRASCGAGRGLTRGRLALVARRLRPVERAFAKIEEDIYDRARSGEVKLIALSNKVKRDMINEHKVAAESIAICHNGAPVGRFPELTDTEKSRLKEILCQSLEIAPNSFLGVFVAMNPRLKGANLFAQALKKTTKHIHGLYIGNRPRHRLRGNEHFLGFRSDIPDLLRLGDLLVLPTHYDPCSLITLEAMAAGLPVLTTRHNGAAELILPELELVSSGPQLGQRLSQLSEDSVRVKALGVANRRAAVNYDSIEAAKRFLECIQGL
jgi:UDP-glucose:(heptosyl)LPS alpha-1,3-glucosyltransferase